MKTTIQTAAPSNYGKQYAFSVTVGGGECPQPLHPKGYFSVTGDIYHKATRTRTGDGTRACGCLHDETLKAFPSLAFLVSLHLSDASTGEPSHAESNGFYILAGAVPELRHFGCEYHAGNAKQHFPIKGNPPEGKPWATTEYREPTPEECLERLARHLRCSLEEARAIREACVNAAKTAPAVPVSVPYPLNTREHREAVKAAEKAGEAGPREAARKAFAALVAEMRPRWVQEAAQAHRQIAAIANRRSGEKVSAAIQRANLVK
jgi:uncharacterized protein GlcG (DUF336 family)